MATDSERRSALQAALATELQRGGRLESQTDVVHGKPVNHVLHLILSVLTAGLWLIVWAILVLTNKPQPLVLSVDEDAQVRRSVTSVERRQSRLSSSAFF